MVLELKQAKATWFVVWLEPYHTHHRARFQTPAKMKQKKTNDLVYERGSYTQSDKGKKKKHKVL